MGLDDISESREIDEELRFDHPRWGARISGRETPSRRDEGTIMTTKLAEAQCGEVADACMRYLTAVGRTVPSGSPSDAHKVPTEEMLCHPESGRGHFARTVLVTAAGGGQ